jgi:uncharacterized membrane protein
MGLSPEERQRIYEEEKVRIEAEQRQKEAAGGTTTGLEPNIAGLLCYLAGWITGIIFLVIEQNRFVRFHAIQSIIVFGALSIASAILTWIPFVGTVFGAIIGVLGFILWIVLMVKAHRGELFKVPLAGDLTERILPSTYGGVSPESKAEERTTEEPKPPLAIAAQAKAFGKRMDDYFTDTRGGRIASSSGAIAWSIILLVFFPFFYGYIAWYQAETIGNVTTWNRLLLLTSDYYTWLPILVTVLLLSIAGHIILIIYDRYLLRQIILIVLNVLGIVAVSTLLSIFPFDFSVIPDPTVANLLPVVVTIALILTAVGLGITSLVMFIKLVVNLAKGSAD